MLSRGTKKRSFQAVSVVLLVGVWGLVAAISKEGVLPGPAETVRPLLAILGSGEVLDPLLGTVVRTVAGFGLGMVGSVGLGIVMARSRVLGPPAYSMVMVGLYMPALIVIFLGMTLLGFSSVTVALIAGATGAPQGAVYVRDVLKSLDPGWFDMADSFRIGLWDRVFRVYLPFLVPVLLSLSRLLFTHAWKITLLCEVLLLPAGIGFQIQLAYRVYQLPTMLGWLVIFIAVLFIYEQLVRIVENAIPWTKAI